MNVLIIDDQPDVVAGIHSGINWDALSIRQVFCANDIIRAREILSNNSAENPAVRRFQCLLRTGFYGFPKTGT